jgi:hypothetical protein
MTLAVPESVRLTAARVSGRVTDRDQEVNNAVNINTDRQICLIEG